MNEQLSATLDEIGGAFDTFKEKQDARVAALEKDIERLQMIKAASPLQSAGVEIQKAKERFAGFIRTGFVDLEGKALSVGSDPDGGYAVDTEISKIVRDQMLDISPMRKVARVEQSTTGDYRINIGRRGTASGWVGETAARPTTASPSFAQVNVPMGEIYANVKVTQRLIDDAMFDVSNYVTTHIADEFNLQEGGAFVSGDGSDKPEGFLNRTLSTNDDSTRTFGQLQYIATGVDGAFAASDPQDDLIDLVYSLRPALRQGQGVAWLMASGTAAVIRKMKDSEGRFIWQDSLQAGEPSRLLGYPVHVFEDMPAIGSDSVSVAFGNWQKGYSIVDRIGIRLLRDPYTDKPNVNFYVTKRVGGSVTDSDAIKLLKFGVS